MQLKNFANLHAIFLLTDIYSLDYLNTDLPLHCYSQIRTCRYDHYRRHQYDYLHLRVEIGGEEEK